VAVIQNKIVIPSVGLEFDNVEISSISTDSSVSLVGEELYIDQFNANVNYYVWIPYVFKPTDRDGIMTSDGYVFCSKQNYDIRTLPYGTKIEYYANGSIVANFYCKTVERVGKSWYAITATSAIGLLDKQYHKGGVYQGTYVQDVIEDIIGTDFDYFIDGIVAVQTVYGWLPYATKRENLYQLMLAYGIECVVGDNGSMFFTFPEVEEAQEIPNDRVFQGGKVIYDEPASLVEVNEHAFFYDPDMAEVVLFDNSSAAAAEDTTVIFDQPIEPTSIYCSSGDIEIHSVYANYAVISGTGILKGKPYVHNIRLISNTNNSATVEKVVSVKDATLVSFVNADNVLNRLSEYYFNVQHVEQDIQVENEKPGLRYISHNSYGEVFTGYILKMTKNISSFARAACQFIVNYTPTGSGQGYTNRLLFPLGDGESHTWEIPEYVFQKETPSFRVTLIGKGQNGEDGANGENGTVASYNRAGKGGAGGAGGAGGSGGNILTVTLLATGMTEITVANEGTESALHSLYYDYSSANGAPSPYGFFDPLSGQIFARAGKSGEAGARGGNGDWYTHSVTSPSQAEYGDDITYGGQTWEGGAPIGRMITAGASVGVSENLRIYVSGCGGGGAAVGSNGGNAYKRDATNNVGGTGGAGRDGDVVLPIRYGFGGNGGYGGGGGGSGFDREWWNYVYSNQIAIDYYGAGVGGKGGKGSEGAWGCAIIYF